MMHAWYSSEHCKRHGYAIYLDKDGKRVAVTAVSHNKGYEDKYRWKDKVYVGMVDKFVQNYESSPSTVDKKLLDFLKKVLGFRTFLYEAGAYNVEVLWNFEDISAIVKAYFRDESPRGYFSYKVTKDRTEFINDEKV